MSWLPAFMQAMQAYLADPNSSAAKAMYGMWDAPDPGYKGFVPGEGGVDLGAPIGTPVYAIASGPIVGAGYWNDDAHGVVTTRIQVPGAGEQDLYYQHITLDPSITDCTGSSCTQSVVAGQKIGTVGPYGETEMGFNANWGGIWGTNHPGPWAIDPRPMLAALITNSPVNPNNMPNTPGNNPGGNPNASGGGTNQLPDWAIKVGLFIAALTLLLLGTWLLFKQQIKSGVKRAVNAGVAIGTGGADVEADKAAITGS